MTLRPIPHSGLFSSCRIISYNPYISSLLLTDDVGATAYFPAANFAGSTTLPTAIDSPTWAAVGTPVPAAQQYVTADLFAAGAPGPSVIVAGDPPSSSQHHQSQQPPPPQQQVPAQPLHVLQPYPQHVSVVPAAPPPTAPQHHPASYLQQPQPVPAAPLQVCIFSCHFVVGPTQPGHPFLGRRDEY